MVSAAIGPLRHLNPCEAAHGLSADGKIREGTGMAPFDIPIWCGCRARAPVVDVAPWQMFHLKNSGIINASVKV